VEGYEHRRWSRWRPTDSARLSPRALLNGALCIVKLIVEKGGQLRLEYGSRPARCLLQPFVCSSGSVVVNSICDSIRDIESQKCVDRRVSIMQVK